MTHRYDWSKLDAGWSCDGVKLTRTGRILSNSLDIVAIEEGHYGTLDELARIARDQLAKCRVDTNAQLANDFLRNRDQARERQRKHEATHGWRNPPCIYEEQT